MENSGALSIPLDVLGAISNLVSIRFQLRFVFSLRLCQNRFKSHQLFLNIHNFSISLASKTMYLSASEFVSSLDYMQIIPHFKPPSHREYDKIVVFLLETFVKLRLRFRRMNIGFRSYPMSERESELIAELLMLSSSRLQTFCDIKGHPAVATALAKVAPNLSRLERLEICSAHCIVDILEHSKSNWRNFKKFSLALRKAEENDLDPPRGDPKCASAKRKAEINEALQLLPLDRLESLYMPAATFPAPWPTTSRLRRLTLKSTDKIRKIYKGDFETKLREVYESLCSQLHSKSLPIIANFITFQENEWEDNQTFNLLEAALKSPSVREELLAEFINAAGPDWMRALPQKTLAGLSTSRIRFLTSFDSFDFWKQRTIVPVMLGKDLQFGIELAEQLLVYLVRHGRDTSVLSAAFNNSRSNIKNANLLIVALVMSTSVAERKDLCTWLLSDNVREAFHIDACQIAAPRNATVLHFCRLPEFFPKFKELGVDPSVLSVDGKTALDQHCNDADDWISAANEFIRIFGCERNYMGSFLYRTAVAMRMTKALAAPATHTLLPDSPVWRLVSCLKIEELLDGITGFLYFETGMSEQLSRAVQKLLKFWKDSNAGKSDDMPSLTVLKVFINKMKYSKPTIVPTAEPIIEILRSLVPEQMMALATSAVPLKRP
jgi:hypothetical protein